MHPFEQKKLPYSRLLFSCVSRLLLSLWLLFINGCLPEHTINTPPPLGQTFAPIFIPPPDTALQSISSFDVYVNAAKVHLIVSGAATSNSKQNKVNYLQSDDGGKHWTKPVEISNHAPAPIATRGNDIQLAVAGQKMLALWQSEGEFPNMGPIVTVLSRDGGQTWTTGKNPANNNNGDQSHLDVVADQQGVFHAVWLEDPEENGYQSIRYAKSSQTGMNWTSALTLDTSTCSCCWNTILITPNNEINVLYRDMEPRDMSLIQSKNNGESWQTTRRVGAFNWKFEGCPHVGGALTFTGNAKISLHSLAWTGAEQFSGLYYLHSENAGESWSAPYRLGNKAVHSDIAATATQIAAVWDEITAEGTEIYFAHSQDGGSSWLMPERLSAEGRLTTHPRIVATSFGFLVLWTEKAPKQASHLALAFFSGK